MSRVLPIHTASTASVPGGRNVRSSTTSAQSTRARGSAAVAEHLYDGVVPEPGPHTEASNISPLDDQGSGTDLAEVERQSAKHWGVGSPQYRWHLAYAAWRCPWCDDVLVPDPHGHRDFRHCLNCKVKWFPQFSNPDGSPKLTSMIACFRVV